MTAKSVRIAVDIGGTFTDLQILDLADGSKGEFKAPSTPDDPSRGLIAALEGAANRFGFSLGDISMLLHGSTIATNAVLERKLPDAALITTAGFTDVLEIGRHMRHDVYSLKAEPRSLLVPRQRRFGVRERIRADGSIETPLDETAVAALGQQLVRDGITTVAVMFLHGYRNPAHEQRAAAVLESIGGLAVASSHEVSPEIREFERVSTTVLNALLKPVISGYLNQLRARLEAAGVTAPLYLVQSNGGVASPEEAARLPAKLLLSGPAGGAMAMAALAREHDLANVVGIDMGGTSSDVSVVVDGRVGETGEGSIDGLPVRLPMIEIRTVGAGGGSIATVRDGALRVGPESAGSVPGPACYGRGGAEATVTDANLYLGRIDGEGFLGGAMRLETVKARSVIEALAMRLGIAPEQAALGVVEVANASMANAVRLSLFEKGADPSAFVLAPFGGAGGLHACAIARDLEMDRIIFPATASTLSARGILMSDLRHDLSHSQLLIAGPDAIGPLRKVVDRLGCEALAVLDEDGVAEAQQCVAFFADCRYRGQAYEIVTPWTAVGGQTGVDEEAIDALVQAFHDLHHQRYAHSSETEAVEIVTVRAVATGLLEQGHRGQASGGVPDGQHEGQHLARKINIAGDWQDVPVVRRRAVPMSAAIGPLLIEEDYASHLIEPGWSVRALDDGSLMAEWHLEAGR